MKTSLFDFHLPESLIATHPADPRDVARMVVVSEVLQDRTVRDLPQFLKPGDIMVFNDTRVIPARLLGRRGQAKVEVLLHKPVIASEAWQSSQSAMGADKILLRRRDGAAGLLRCARNDGLWHCFAKPAKKLKPGDRIDFAEDFYAAVKEKLPGGEIVLEFGADLMMNLQRYGHMPLPPYIRRDDDASDRSHYQTLYAKHDGSVAAPTAGLHFTEELLAALDAAGVERVHVTLHVGGGTFLPVKSEDTQDHVMHSEYVEITPATAEAVNRAKAAGGRVIAVGTTSLRALESAADEKGRMQPFRQETSIFITPGYRFRIVDILLTNFHLPRSTLFMLASAFSRLDRMQSAYRHAIAQGYRFYSYGDACLLYPFPEN